MSALKALLKDVPVEWKALGELTEIKTGEKPPIIAGIQTEFEYINAGTTNSGYCYDYNCNGDTVTTPSRGQGGIGFIGYQIEKFWLGPLCYKIISKDNNKVLNKFLYYFISSFRKLILDLKKEGGVPAVNKSDLEKIQIPIPHPNDPEKSLAIQQEIVRVLDSLSEQNKALTTALAQEIDQRKKQYEYYREELFRFESKEVEWKKISEIGTFQRGKRFVRTDMISEGVPCIHYGEMYTHYGIWAREAKSYLSAELVSSKKLRVAEKNDVVIVAAGETIEDIGKGTAWLGEEGVVIHDACFSYRSPLNPVYFAYFTRTILFHDQIRRNISSGKISAINEKGFSKVVIPVQSIQEQERIVRLLDQLDEATKNIVAQLEKEIELRNKQYEYYRNQLLMFNG